MKMYHSVAWHRELAEKIAEGGRDDLVEKIGRVADKVPEQALGPVEPGKDPLSFFGFLRNSQSKSNEVCKAVQDVFGLEAELPDPGELRDIIFPPASASLSREGAMFPVGNDDLLWRLFKQAAEDNPHIDQKDWKDALDVDGVEVGTLTQALFLVNPDFFLPVDSAVDVCFSEGWREEKGEKIKGNEGYEKYLATRVEIKNRFPGCEPYEIYTFLRWQEDKGAISKDSKLFQISTNAHGDGTDFWDKKGTEDINFRENNWVFVGGPGGGMGGWEVVEEKSLSREDIENAKGTYRLLAPKQGDIILVRTGKAKGRAIGIVLENDYNKPDGLKRTSKIHVLWINKSESRIAGGGPRGLSYGGAKTPEHFANAEVYKSSFQLLNSLTGKAIGSGEQVNQDSQQARANTREQPPRLHPLNMILYGPPGTGKTYNTSHYAVAIIEDKEEVKKGFDEYRDNGQVEMVTFHQNYAYEDFIEGIRPVLSKEGQGQEIEGIRPVLSKEGQGQGQGQEIEYELSQGIFKKISRQAEKAGGKKNYVLIIDEINRGNIAKIFGELITLIEESRRLGETEATKVTLPYSGKSFGVPNNLYIIGTMNTADRSIALLDTALRRRFVFKEMMPDPSLIERDIEGVSLKELLEKMNERIRVLLDREHQIGHTYFFGVKDMKALKKAFQNKIIPLLQEYFYDNWEKIDLVLNQNGFIDSKSIDEFIDSDRFKKSDLIDKQGKIHEILSEDDKDNGKKWDEPESYKNIYKKGENAQNQEQNESGSGG